MPIPQKGRSGPRLTAKELVYNTLLEWITDGTLQPGEKLSDQEIAGYFSVSRTPVREALQLLADQRLIDVIPGRESRVAQVDLEQAGSNYLLMGNLNAVALDLCAARIDKAFLAKLRTCNQKMAAALARSDLPQVRRGDWDFHQAFFALAENYFLSSFASTLYNHCLRIENLYFSAPKDPTSVQTHEQIISALEQGDLPTAREKLLQNWTDTMKELSL